MYVLERDEKLPDTRPDEDLIRSWASSAKEKSVVTTDGCLNPDPVILEQWEPALRQNGLRRFAETMLCTCDSLLKTGFRKDRGILARLRAGSYYLK